MKALFVAALMLVAGMRLTGAPAVLIAYAVGPEQMNQALSLTPEQCEERLVRLWNASAEFRVQAPVVVSYAGPDVVVTLELVGTPGDFWPQIEIQARLTERLTSRAGASAPRALGSTLSLVPGSARILGLLSTQSSRGSEQAGLDAPREGVLYVLRLEADPAES